MNLDDLVSELIKTKWLKRLDKISLSDVPPNILKRKSSSRLEHSLKVYELAKVVVQNNKLPEEIAIAGLLHDMGHGPFGHVSDEFLRVDEFGKDHVAFGAELVKGRAQEVSAILDKFKLDKSLIAEIMEGKNPRYSLFINDFLDLDCVENIFNFYKTANLSEFFNLELYDPFKVADSYTFHDDKICIDSTCTEHVKRYIELRKAVYEWLWGGRNLKACAMLGKALDIAYDDGKIDEEFFLMNNEEALNYLGSLESTKKIVRRIKTGRFCHTVLRATLLEYPVKGFVRRKRRLEMEHEIGEDNNIIVVIGEAPLQKRITVPFINLKTHEFIEPDSFFSNKDLFPVYVEIYCKNRKFIGKYKERAKSILRI